MEIIGRTEEIYFENIDIFVKSKIDTGAWNNSLHADEISILDNKLYFKINNIQYIYENFKEVKVRSSFGKEQNRFIIKLNIKIGDNDYKSSFSLSDRSKMKYRCLIGRKFLSKNNFIVDVNKKMINGRSKKN